MKLLDEAAKIYSEEGIYSLAKSSVGYVFRKSLENIHQPIYSRLKGYKYVDIMNEDWDSLIILDGCRYDLFDDINMSHGVKQVRHSQGSSTPEFLKNNITDKYNDTVYVTANPQYAVNDIKGGFHSIVNVWETDWSSSLGTVHPGSVTKKAIEAHQRHPNKRLLVHYMQPHYPFIGEIGQQLPDTSKFESLRYELQGKGGHHASDDDVWTLLRRGEVDTAKVISAYKENLELCIPHIKKLNDNINGKTVVTSDHGNLYGERVFPFPRKKYGHPTGLHAENLIKIPWIILEDDNRRKIDEAGVSSEREQVSQQEVIDKLEHLGYINN